MSSTVTNDLKEFSPDKAIVQQPHPLYDNFGSAIPKSEALKLLNLDPNFHYLLFFGFIVNTKDSISR